MAKVIVEVIKVMVVGDVSSIEMEIENLWEKRKESTITMRCKRSI